MATESGSAFLLKIGSHENDSYDLLAGMTATSVLISGAGVEITNCGSGGWRTLLSGAGLRSLTVAASGIFMGSEAERRARELALSGHLAPLMLVFAGGDNLSGRFLITALEYSGEVDGERQYRVTLESSGPVTGVG